LGVGALVQAAQASRAAHPRAGARGGAAGAGGADVAADLERARAAPGPVRGRGPASIPGRPEARLPARRAAPAQGDAPRAVGQATPALARRVGETLPERPLAPQRAVVSEPHGLPVGLLATRPGGQEYGLRL